MLLFLVCIVLPTLSIPLPRLANKHTACCFLIWIEILVNKKPWNIGQGFGLRILLNAYLLNGWIMSDFLGENVTFYLLLFRKDPCLIHDPKPKPHSFLDLFCAKHLKFLLWSDISTVPSLSSIYLHISETSI